MKNFSLLSLNGELLGLRSWSRSGKAIQAESERSDDRRTEARRQKMTGVGRKSKEREVDEGRREVSQ